MSNPVMERLRRGLAAGAARAESDAGEAQRRLAAAGGTAENELVRIQVDAAGQLLAVHFAPGTVTATPPGWSTAVRSAYAAACDRIGPLPSRPETVGHDPGAVHRPGTSRDGQAQRSAELARRMPEMVVEAERDGVRVSLTGLRQLAGATVTEQALLAGPEVLGGSFTAAWAEATSLLETTMRAALAGPLDEPGSR